MLPVLRPPFRARPCPWPLPHPQVPQEAYAEFAKGGQRGAEARKQWEEVSAWHAPGSARPCGVDGALRCVGFPCCLPDARRCAALAVRAAQVRAAYAEKYPEEYAEFESIMTGKLPADWAEKLPKFTAEGEEGGPCWAGEWAGQGPAADWFMTPGLPALPCLLCDSPVACLAAPCPQTRAWPPACTARPC